MAAEDASRHPTQLLKALAIVLIVNSHLKEFHPLALLASGGAIGNALFFMLSGYGLSHSLSNRPLPLPAYCLRRAVKIYPSVWVVTLVVFIPLKLYLGAHADLRAAGLLAQFVWPQYWFLQAILVAYIPLYLVLRIDRPWAYAAAFAATLLLYFLSYSTLDLSTLTTETSVVTKSLFYFTTMLTGALLARAGQQPRSAARDLLSSVVLLAAIVLLKRLFHLEAVRNMQFLQQFLLVPLVVHLFWLAHSTAAAALFRSTALSRGIGLLAGLTLEIYLVHVNLLGLPELRGLPLPVNIAAFTAATLGLAWIVRQIGSRLTEGLQGTLSRRS